jgi:hypothetical protein
VFQGLLALSITLALFAFAKLLACWYDQERSKWLALAMLYPIVFNYLILGDYIYPYDLPAIAFFTISLYFIVRDQFWALAITTLFATLNRESSLIAIVVYLLWNIQEGFKLQMLKRTSILAAIWLAVKITVTLTLTSTGSVHENGVDFNLMLFSEAFSGNWKYLSGLLFMFGGLHFVWLALLFKKKAWNERALDLASLFFLALLFYTGRWEEERIFNELIPIFTLITIWYLAPRRWLTQNIRAKHWPEEMQMQHSMPT